MTEQATTPDRVVATIPDGDKRAEAWKEYFDGLFVPVTKDEPDMTILPDDTQRLCYFVDFTACDWLLPRLRAVATRRNSLTVLAMLEQQIYPIEAEGVIVIRAPVATWQRFQQPP
jgi:hypothetical protein